jgi:hypothetical protein
MCRPFARKWAGQVAKSVLPSAFMAQSRGRCQCRTCPRQRGIAGHFMSYQSFHGGLVATAHSQQRRFLVPGFMALTAWQAPKAFRAPWPAQLQRRDDHARHQQQSLQWR